MSASAGLERHSTSGALCQKRDQVVTSEPAIGNLTGLCINPIHLEHPLCNIQSIGRNIHLGPPFLKWLRRNSTLAH
jgi:hypothetical protein